MPDTPSCSECGRPLLIAAGSLTCCYRLCGAYGQAQDAPAPDTTADDEPADYDGQWLRVRDAIRATKPA